MEHNTNLQIFNFQEQQVRTIIIDGEIWFVIADACKVLSIANVSQATDRLDQDGVCLTEVIDSMGRSQKAAVANEPNLYRLIFRSDKPQAKAFQDWVYKEVLPTIRRTGNYSLDSHQQEPPALLEERLHCLERQVADLMQSRLLNPARKQASSEDTTVKVTKRVLVFLQRQDGPVSRRIIITYTHCTVAVIEPILDQLVASGQVSRIKLPGSRVQWFYRLSEDEMTVTESSSE